MAAPIFRTATARGYMNANRTVTSFVTTPAECSAFVFLHWEGSASEPTITDNKGNVYARIGTVQVNNGSYQNWCALYWCQNAVGGAAHTIQADKTGGYISVYFETCDRANLIDNSQAGATTDPYPTGDVTISAENLLLAYFGYQGTTTGTHSLPVNWISTSAITSSSFWQGNSARRVVSTPGDYNCALTVSSGTPDDGGGIIVALEAQPAGPDPLEGDIATGTSGTAATAGTAAIEAAAVVSQPTQAQAAGELPTSGSLAVVAPLATPMAAVHVAVGGEAAVVGSAATASMTGSPESPGALTGDLAVVAEAAQGAAAASAEVQATGAAASSSAVAGAAGASGVAAVALVGSGLPSAGCAGSLGVAAECAPGLRPAAEAAAAVPIGADAAAAGQPAAVSMVSTEIEPRVADLAVVGPVAGASAGGAASSSGAVQASASLAEVLSGGEIRVSAAVSTSKTPNFTDISAEIGALQADFSVSVGPILAASVDVLVVGEASVEAVPAAEMSTEAAEIPTFSVKLTVKMPDSALNLLMPDTKLQVKMPDTGLSLRM